MNELQQEITQAKLTSKSLSMQTEELLTLRDEMNDILEHAARNKATIDAELFNRCGKTVSKSLELVPEGRIVKIITVRDFKTVALEFADKYEATTIVVNTKVLKALADTGTFIPGVKEREQLYVK